MSQLIGLTFDALLRDVFLPLTSGATLCVPTDSDLLDTIGWMQREGVTVVHTTPTVMQSWLLDGERRLDLASLRWLFVAGEPLTDVLISRWRRIISSPAQLVNLYGPTETTMIRCFYIIPVDVTPGVQPIGVPLPDSQALVLNAIGMLCGIGEIGEIVLRTPFRSLGYLNLPEETARCFRPNAFRDDASDLLYFTGDRGRYRPDGLLEIAGRVDHQVKIRGVRIDPGEVTATLARHEAVRQCVVVGHDDVHGQHPTRRLRRRGAWEARGCARLACLSDGAVAAGICARHVRVSRRVAGAAQRQDRPAGPALTAVRSRRRTAAWLYLRAMHSRR